MAAEVELLLDAHAEVGEGPIWHPEDGTLLWVDINGHAVHRYHPDSGRDESFDVGAPVGSAAYRASGGLVLAMAKGFAFFDFTRGRVQPLAPIEADDPTTLMNDGKADSRGRFWAGTLVLDSSQPGGSLYRLDVDCRVTRMVEGVICSNGLGWSPDDRQMYYVDSMIRRLDVFDFEAAGGTLANRRPLVELPADLGVPDGLTVDADGFVWLAVWGGWCVRRYSPRGELEREIRLPVSQVSSCTFGGPDLRDLYITSAWEDFTPERHAREPHAGALFRCRPGPQGLPANEYRG